MERLRGKAAIGHGTAVSPLNFSKEVRGDMELPKQVKLVDMSLKEGRQMGGVVLSNEQYFYVAQQLDELGVPSINIAYRLKRPEDVALLKGLAKLKLKAEILCIVFNNQVPPAYSNKDLLESIDAVLDFGYTPFWCCALSNPVLRGFGDFRGEKNKSLDYLKDKEVELGLEIVRRAKKQKGRIAANVQDPMRCDLDFMDRMVKELSKAGIDFMIFDDLAMPGVPAVFKYILRRAKKVAPKAVFGNYVHDDFGFGLGAALAAVEGGAEVQLCGINAYGKRGGMVDLAQLAVVLETMYGFDTGIKLEKLYDISRLFADIYRQPLPRTRAITGSAAYTHSGDWHVQFAFNPDHPGNPWVVQSIPPELVGQKATVALSSASGQMAIRIKAAELGIKLTVDQALKVYAALRDELCWRTRPLEDEEFIKVVRRALPKVAIKK